MAFHTLSLENKAIDVAISESGTRLAVLSNTDVALYALDLHKRPVPKPSFLWKSDAIATHCPRHVAFVGDEQLFCLTDNWDEDESCLWRSEGTELLPLGPLVESDGASLLLPDIGYETLCVQFQNGALHRVDIGEASAGLPPQTSVLHQFPSLAPEVKVVTINEQVCATWWTSPYITNCTRPWPLD
jgi:elongator complex protein 1